MNCVGVGENLLREGIQYPIELVLLVDLPVLLDDKLVRSEVKVCQESVFHRDTRRFARVDGDVEGTRSSLIELAVET